MLTATLGFELSSQRVERAGQNFVANSVKNAREKDILAYAPCIGASAVYPVVGTNVASGVTKVFQAGTNAAADPAGKRVLVVGGKEISFEITVSFGPLFGVRQKYQAALNPVPSVVINNVQFRLFLNDPLAG